MIGIWAAVVCSLLIQAAPAGDRDAARQQLDPSSDRAARLLKVQPRYALWLSSELRGVYAFDAASGALLGEPEYAKRPRNVASVIAVRNAIGYYYESGALRATDLAARDGASIRVRDAQPVVPLQSDDGLTVWDGTRWTLVPWLKSLPRP